MTKAGLKIKLRVYDDLNVVNSHQLRGRDYQRPPPPQLKQRHFGASLERPSQPVTVNNNTAQSNTATPDTAAVAAAGNDIIN